MFEPFLRIFGGNKRKRDHSAAESEASKRQVSMSLSQQAIARRDSLRADHAIAGPSTFDRAANGSLRGLQQSQSHQRKMAGDPGHLAAAWVTEQVMPLQRQQHQQRLPALFEQGLAPLGYKTLIQHSWRQYEQQVPRPFALPPLAAQAGNMLRDPPTLAPLHSPPTQPRSVRLPEQNTRRMPTQSDKAAQQPSARPLGLGGGGDGHNVSSRTAASAVEAQQPVAAASFMHTRSRPLPKALHAERMFASAAVEATNQQFDLGSLSSALEDIKRKEGACKRVGGKGLCCDSITSYIFITLMSPCCAC
jgi:hypothetical protein